MMQENIRIYQENKNDLEKFIIQTLVNNGQYLHAKMSDLKQFYKILPSLELIYITDQNYKQVSVNQYRRHQLESAKGRDRQYLVAKVKQKDAMVSISEPYISSATAESCITLMMKLDDCYVFFDFNLMKLLSRFGLIERHELFNILTKSVYFAIGASLMFFSIMSTGYAFYDYGLQLFAKADDSIESLFKPIVALTMGLAIFDLAKTLMEREVFFKAYADKKDDVKLLSKFLTAIIIALSIEALMVVFKIALSDTSQLLNALYLIVGVALIILSLSVYHHLVVKSHR